MWPALLVAHPTSPSRLAWHVLGALLILSDLFRLPLELAFRPEEADFSRALDWITLLYWTLNMPAELVTGYVEHGLVVLSPRRILIRYLKTWFLVDVLVLVPDWIFTIGSLRHREGGSSQGYSRFLNVVRLVRLARLLRLLKLRKIHDMLNEMITSEYVSVLMNIVTMILVLLLINHLISCAWFAVGNSQDSHTPSWTTTANMVDVNDWVYMYAMSFHWSITHGGRRTPATVEVSPENLSERIFAIVVVIFALVVFSYIVGSITSSLAQLRSMHAEESTLFWDLRRYLQNRVTRTLSLRIQKYLEYAWRVQQERKPAKSIRLMCLLSEQLFSELQCEMAVAQLQVHPFLAKLCDASTVTAQRLANAGISHKLVARGDFLFYPGEAATHLFIVVEGSSEYSRVDVSGNVCREAVKNNEDWIAEPVLWTKWLHRGLLTALEDGDELAIDGKKFGELARLNPKAHTFASKYAHNFIKWLNDQDPRDLTDISQGEDMRDLVQSFMGHGDDHDHDNGESDNVVITASMTPMFSTPS
ncbi:unnamed protein product [Prorocentrum cordatum]|uniref:Ion transport domain-containing protein n=1 Tax=Prorocentrum cordatum TaxID=2364126 RepID=A0ABN9V2C0_9DINO|nr:unnamed protein product [Polarella glacialis]